MIMVEIRFFKCNLCGNVDMEIVKGTGTRVCCGQEMELMVANTSDGATEKHVPVITRDGETVTVKVSTVDHPMIPAHWITTIAVAYGDTYQVKHLNAGDAPQAVFTVPANQKVTAYEYCNLHGLWVAAE